MRAPIALVIALSACGSTAAGTASDAGAGADVASGACAWRVGPVRDLAAPASSTSCALSDLAATGDGAWVLRACEVEAGAAFTLAHAVDRVDADGLAAAPVTVGVTRARASLTPSLALDEALSRRGVLTPEATDEPPTLWRLDGSAARLGSSPIAQAPDSFSLAGYQRLMVNRAGFTAVAEQVRALWGVSMLQLDATGAAVSAVDLGLPISPTVRFERAPLPDRTFVMAWSERDAATGAFTLRARRHQEDGAPFTRESHTLDARAAERARVAVAPAGDGLLAVWEAVSDTLPPLSTVAARRLARDGAPLGAANLLTAWGFYLGGLDVASSRGDALATGVSGSGVLRLSVMVLGFDGAPRGEPLTVSPVAPVADGRTAARIVATAAGALVAFQRDARTVSVAALTCEARGRL